ncbi:ComEA family DNA-binding protein [Candidatus Microgenomates bacterium]|nr:ComEA family DNA-binding protein [Candidatus Microgenomates bacterium]
MISRAIITAFFEKYRLSIGLGMILILLLWGGAVMIWGANQTQGKIITSEDFVSTEKQNISSQKIVFDIEGGVEKPGVYRLNSGSVIADAIEKAGGLSSIADRFRIVREINQAAIIGNNSKIYIFTLSDANSEMVISGNGSGYLSLEASGQTVDGGARLININTADLSQLDSLPGIGPAIGQRIIDWRQANNGFEIIEDLKKVKGIGEALFEKIKSQISV